MTGVVGGVLQGQLQGDHAVKLRHGVIGDNQVRPEIFQRVKIFTAIIHLLKLARGERTANLMFGQLSISRRVLNDQNTSGFIHGRFRHEQFLFAEG